MVANVAHQQILRGVSATLSVTLHDSNGEPAAPAGTVTVRVQRADGTDILAAGTATSAGVGTGVRTVALTAAQTATLDLLTATWTDSSAGAVTTLHEIVGGYYFTLTEARAIEPSLDDPSKYPDALMLAVRREVEEEFERICSVAFVPRYRRVALDGTGTTSLWLHDPRPRVLRSARIYLDSVNYIAFTADDLTAVRLAEWGVIDRSLAVANHLAGAIFPVGQRNILVEYEHGYDRPPAEIKRAALARLRYRLNLAKSGVPDNAQSYTAQNGATYRLARPGQWATGSDEIDAVLERFSMRVPGVA
jgi:hypothetical protein